MSKMTNRNQVCILLLVLFAFVDHKIHESENQKMFQSIAVTREVNFTKVEGPKCGLNTVFHEQNQEVNTDNKTVYQ